MQTQDNLISIYALIDPDTSSIRYVGRSHDAEQRLSGHMCSAKPLGTAKEQWLYSLKQAGKKPALTILEEVPWQSAAEAELWWMFHYRDKGEPLTNSGSDLGRAKQKYGPLPQWHVLGQARATWAVDARGSFHMLSSDTPELWNACTFPNLEKAPGVFEGIFDVEYRLVGQGSSFETAFYRATLIQSETIKEL